jgi:hypothetical protein
MKYHSKETVKMFEALILKHPDFKIDIEPSKMPAYGGPFNGDSFTVFKHKSGAIVFPPWAVGHMLSIIVGTEITCDVGFGSM